MRYLVVTETTRVPITDPVIADFVEAFINSDQSTFTGNYGLNEAKGAKTTVEARIEEG